MAAVGIIVEGLQVRLTIEVQGKSPLPGRDAPPGRFRRLHLRDAALNWMSSRHALRTRRRPRDSGCTSLLNMADESPTPPFHGNVVSPTMVPMDIRWRRAARRSTMR